VTDWDELKQILAELSARQPNPLISCPGLDSDATPPFRIHLAPWAEPVASRLHARFGDRVQLIVGVLGYPPGESAGLGRLARGGQPDEPLDPAEISVELAGPAVVRSGRTLHHGLLVTNHLASEIGLATNGGITAAVIDPESGEVVGGYAGWQTAPLKLFRIPPGATERIPLLIGTASTTPRLGYVIPPGTWALQVTLTVTGPDIASAVRDTDRKVAPPLPLTVT